MKIETKYDIGDRVWIKNWEINQYEILQIVFAKDWFLYYLYDNIKPNCYKEETDCFLTKEALLASL